IRMILSDWAFLLYAVYVPLLLALYLLELIAIFKHRQTLFNSSFYSVFSVLSFINYSQLWRPRALLVGISLCLLLSIPPVNHIINQQTHFMKFLVGEDKHSSYWMLSDEPDGASIWFNIALVSVVCNSASFLLYGACLIRLCSFSKLRNSTAERNLFLVGVLTSIVTLPYMTAMMPWLTDLK
ncbi:hypothetical protein PENTCL1PPCAC_13939, partial [Pristionchus entomophagus]